MKKLRKGWVTLLLAFAFVVVLFNFLSLPLLSSVLCGNGRCVCHCVGNFCTCINDYDNECWCYCADPGIQDRCSRPRSPDPQEP